MLVAFLESIKYVGHLWPVALIRVVLGYQYLKLFFLRLQSGYLDHAYISERLDISHPPTGLGGIYFDVFKSLIQSQWLAMTYLLLGCELIIGISFILGLGVRFTSLLGALLSLHMYSYFDFPSGPGQIYLFYIHVLFLLVGAGRCLGFDYYFFKSRRGLLW